MKAALTGTLGQMFTMVEMISKINVGMSVLSSSPLNDKTRFEGEIKSMMHQTGLVQGAVDILMKQNEDKKQGGGGHKKWNVLESKSVANMKSLGSDEMGFRAWHEKLVNVMEQITPGCRGILRALVKYVDQEEDEDLYEWMENTEEYSKLDDPEKTLERINEDLYVILMDKAEAEALTRVRACPVGEGLEAYKTVYKWFTGVSGQAISDKIRKLMAPSTPKAEQDIADQLDKWIESIRALEARKAKYKLPDPFKTTALEQIMAVGQAKLYFENIKIAGGSFDNIFAKCKEYAMRRRVEHGHKKGKDDMDVDHVGEDAWGMGGED